MYVIFNVTPLMRETFNPDITPPGKNKEELVYSKRVGIKEYAVTKGETTEALLDGTIIQATERIIQEATKEGLDTEKTEIIVNELAPKIVAEVTADHMGSGLSIPRVFFGGKHELADVIGAASCVDAAVFTKTVLEQGFGITSEIKSARLGVVPNHHFVELATGEVIDPIIGGKKNPGGYFKTKKRFQRRLDIINSGGLNVIVKQIKNIIRSKTPQKRESQTDHKDHGENPARNTTV